MHTRAGTYVGTFRWSGKKDFQPLPEWKNENVAVTAGWEAYLQTRWADEEEEEGAAPDSKGGGSKQKKKNAIDVSTIDGAWK